MKTKFAIILYWSLTIVACGAVLIYDKVTHAPKNNSALATFIFAVVLFLLAVLYGWYRKKKGIY